MAEGQWGTITFEVPDFLDTTRDKINSAADYLVSVLDVALAALDLAKTFLVGYLDPIVAIIQAILDELNAMILDLRQLGIYITGDWGLLAYPYDDLKGGYQEYERRMIARLTDRSDPSRPDVSAKTNVLSFFFYLSVDPSEIQRLIGFVRQLLAFFGQSYQPVSGMPFPVITDVLYGADASTILQVQGLGKFFKKHQTPPSVALLKWRLNSAAQRHPFNPFPTLPPGGFIVTVSTIREGIRIVYDRPRSNDTLKPTDSGKQAQSRESGPVLVLETGQPLVLYGGLEMLDLRDGFQYNQSIKNDVPQYGYTRIYGLLPDGHTIVPLNQLRKHGAQITYLFQRTFFVPTASVGAAWATGDYTILLDAAEMPHTGQIIKNGDGTLTIEDGGPASTFYVRVAACTKGVIDEEHYQFSPGIGVSATSKPGAPVMAGVSEPTALGPWSDPKTVVIPGANTSEYLEALKTALLVLVLSRPDLIPLDEFQQRLSIKKSVGADGKIGLSELERVQQGHTIVRNLALRRCGLEPFKHLTDLVCGDYHAALAKQGENPTSTRKDMLRRIEIVAHDLYTRTGPVPQVEQFVVEQTKTLRSVTWDDILVAVHPSDLAEELREPLKNRPLLDLIPQGASTGIGMNPYCIGLPEQRVLELQFTDVIQDRDPDMQTSAIPAPLDLPHQIPADQVTAVLQGMPPGLRQFYEKMPLDEEGNLVVPTGQYTDLLGKLTQPGRKVGSADMSPVLYVGGDRLGDSTGGRIFYCRGLLAKFEDGVLFREAAIALGIAGAAIRRSSKDQQWIALRAFDAFPGIEDFMVTITDWIGAVKNAIQSIVDTITRYIEFIEARIVDIQQLIQRINGILQSILGFSFQIPKCSALMLLSDGTDGVLTDLITAKNKPNDSPLSYGAGLAVVVPFGPAWAMDMIRALMKPDPEGTPAQPGATMAALPDPNQGIDGIPVVPPQGDEPDVL